MIIDTAYKIKVMQAYLEGNPIEFFNGYSGDWEEWPNDLEPAWSWLSTSYRVKEPTKPSINWDEVSDKYNWLARDEGGSTYLYTSKPISICEVWSGAYFAEAEGFKSLDKGNCDWEDSLVQRPIKEKGE